MTVSDISGRLLHRGENVLDPGTGSLTWTPEGTVPAGIYVVRLEGIDWSHSQRVTLIR